jgi:hypothetical protein
MSAHELIALGNGACIEVSIFTSVLEDYLSSWPLCLMAGIFVNCVSVPAFVFLFSCTTLDVFDRCPDTVLLCGPELPCIY